MVTLLFSFFFLCCSCIVEHTLPYLMLFVIQWFLQQQRRLPRHFTHLVRTLATYVLLFGSLSSFDSSFHVFSMFLLYVCQMSFFPPPRYFVTNLADWLPFFGSLFGVLFKKAPPPQFMWAIFTDYLTKLSIFKSLNIKLKKAYYHPSDPLSIYA